MHYLALACDYDGTLARDGRVETGTVAALDRFRAASGRLVLVTGRQLDDLQAVFPAAERFDRIVAEDGAVLYVPADGRERLFGAPPPPKWIETLRKRSVHPLSVGKVIVATREPHSAAVAEWLRWWNPGYRISLNKGAVMVLPDGVDKATGLAAALEELGLKPTEMVAMGDAENDLPFLELCGLSVAPANALEVVKARVGRVTIAENGAGVIELIDWLLAAEHR